MQRMPEVVPISQLRDPAKIFSQIKKGPVILTQRSKSTAVLVSIDEWNLREHHIEILEARLKHLEMKQQFAENPPEMLTLEQISQEYNTRNK
ncbi:MAG: type II toxin-antitoxin system prevent-host-death family antitoxin [Caldilineaceae bacterium]